MIKRLVRKIFWWAITPQAIEAAINRQKNLANRSKVTIAESASFYEETKVLSRVIDKERIRIGENSHLRCDLFVFPFGGQIDIGQYTFVGDGSRIWSGEKILIGNHVMISHNVNIMDSNSHELDHLERANSFMNLLKSGHPKVKGSIKTAPVVIHDYAWIGFGATILKGVTIGAGAIVGACSVVTQDVAPFAIVVGNPAQVVSQQPSNK